MTDYSTHYSRTRIKKGLEEPKPAPAQMVTPVATPQPIAQPSSSSDLNGDTFSEGKAKIKQTFKKFHNYLKDEALRDCFVLKTPEDQKHCVELYHDYLGDIKKGIDDI